MLNELNIGIGFVTGRKNVCNVINAYYGYVKQQMCSYYKNTNITFYILYDTEYQNTKKEDFYNLDAKIFEEENIKVKYITPEYIVQMKEKIKDRYQLKDENVDLIIGNGHAKGRNTIMYEAYHDRMNYLYFWDDDEYPVACIKNEDGSVLWKMQDNVLKHIEMMEETDADITIGYHCGYISPIPYLKFENEEDESCISDFIEAISNEVVTWENIKNRYEHDNGVTYADKIFANGEGAYEMQEQNGAKFVVGSTLCINLNNIDKIPAFYNPVGARGEDAFFSLGLKNCKVLKLPVYHFHDGFLKYKSIMKNKFPEKLRLILYSEDEVEKRFYKACLGWIKYKPLFVYLLKKDRYREIIDNVYKKLENSVGKINKLSVEYDFHDVYNALKQYDMNVEEDYNKYILTNKIWNELKTKLYIK